MSETRRYSDEKHYLVRGRTLNRIEETLEALWGGGNITRGPGILLRGGGRAGLSITSSASQKPDVASAQDSRPYFVTDASSGATAKIAIVPGDHNGITLLVEGSPLSLTNNVLTLAGTETVAYFQLDYDDANLLTGGSIHATDAGGWAGLLAAIDIVPGTAGTDYKKLSDIVITIAAGKASVTATNGTVSGPQGYRQCGSTSDVWLA